MLVHRLADTAIGIASGLLVNLVVWPPLRARAAIAAIDVVDGRIGELLGDIGDGLRARCCAGTPRSATPGGRASGSSCWRRCAGAPALLGSLASRAPRASRAAPPKGSPISPSTWGGWPLAGTSTSGSIRRRSRRGWRRSSARPATTDRSESGLLLDRRGGLRLEATPLGEVGTDGPAGDPTADSESVDRDRPSPGPVRPLRLGLAAAPVDPADPFLYHKTTQRRVYEEALAARPECDDVLLWNPRGEATESCRANLVVRLDGEWVTPPVACGLLPGTLRARLLAAGRVGERAVSLADLARCEPIYLVSSLRGWRRAELIEAAPPIGPAEPPAAPGRVTSSSATTPR